MTRLLALCLLLASTKALAQAAPAAPAPKPAPKAAARPTDKKAAPPAPAEPAPAAPAAPAEPATPPPPPGPTAEELAQQKRDIQAQNEQLKRDIQQDVQQQLAKNRDDIREEIRAQMTTAAANRTFEEEFQEEKRKLELLELDGYFRTRPDLFYNFNLGRGADPSGNTLFPPPVIGGEATNAPTQAGGAGPKTQTSANMRFRLEPTLNVSEDVRIKAQVDFLDNLIFGSTPEGGFGVSERNPITFFSNSQVPPQAGRTSYADSVQVKRVYGEVMTPVGLFRFGRMGSQWGLGVLANDGNCIDCDHGDTVDRFQFVAKVAGHYIVPMVDFVTSGITSAKSTEFFGQPISRDNLDDATSYILAIAKRDTEVEANRKLAANQDIFNYGLYFVYRRQTWDATGFQLSQNPFGGDVSGTGTFVPRLGSSYTPDLWAKYQTRKLRLETELVGVFGTIQSHAPVEASIGDAAQELLIRQFGAVVQGDYKVLDNLLLGGEVGFASGDKAFGMGNLPGRGGPTGPGSIDGAQFNCTPAGCPDNTINNFRFNRDYRIDLILWRSLLMGVTDAIYVKPTLNYEVTDGLKLHLSPIYSRAVYANSTPSSHVDDQGNTTGDPNLGIEIDGGVSYTTDDGFFASINYGVLFPLAGLRNNVVKPELEAGTAQAVHAIFAVRF